jgi:hypothetical protein
MIARHEEHHAELQQALPAAADAFHRISGVTEGGQKGILSGDLLAWGASLCPTRVVEDLQVPSASTLVLSPGCLVVFGKERYLSINGGLLAAGKSDAVIWLRADTPSCAYWGGVEVRPSSHGVVLKWVSVSGGQRLLKITGSGFPTIFEDCAFDDWAVDPSTEGFGIYYTNVNQVIIRRSTFAMSSADPPAGEAVNGVKGGCLIEHCTFGKVSGRADVIDITDQHWTDSSSTIIRYNTFLGGNDDGIDLDSVDGFVYSNLLQDFQPNCDPTLCTPDVYCCDGGNGGAITGGARGSDSRPVIFNNIIRRCYHGIGFKDGAHPLLLNNAIVDCYIGITLYNEGKDAANTAPGLATTANNIIWHHGGAPSQTYCRNCAASHPSPRSIVLGSTWWPEYQRTGNPYKDKEVRISKTGCCPPCAFPLFCSRANIGDMRSANIAYWQGPDVGRISVMQSIVQGAESFPVDLLDGDSDVFTGINTGALTNMMEDPLLSSCQCPEPTSPGA